MQPPNRYHRQILLPQIGEPGQARLAQSKILLIGCGALGTVIAEQLTRAGVGYLRIVDRDIVELTNLQRQTLFTESDAAAGLPKSIAAANRLRSINSTITIDPLISDVHSNNIEELARQTNLILDGTDNAETRYLLNDTAVKNKIPWIYAAAIATQGRAMPILPNKSSCLRCIFPNPPTTGELPTCDTAGVLAPATTAIASLQTVLAIKILIGSQIENELTSLDLWTNKFQTIHTGDPNPTCPCCAMHNFEFLNQNIEQSAITLCGRNSVQIRPPRTAISLSQLAARLAPVAQIEQSDYFLRLHLNHDNNITMTIFPDGRTIIHGTTNITHARQLLAQYVGT